MGTLENRPFDLVHRSKMPGADSSTPLYAVARSGCDVAGVTHVTPEDLPGVWR